jgi:hypothetical protein
MPCMMTMARFPRTYCFPIFSAMLIRVGLMSGPRDSLPLVCRIGQPLDTHTPGRLEKSPEANQPRLPEMADHREAHEQSRVGIVANLDPYGTKTRFELQQRVLDLGA